MRLAHRSRRSGLHTATAALSEPSSARASQLSTRLPPRDTPMAISGPCRSRWRSAWITASRSSISPAWAHRAVSLGAAAPREFIATEVIPSAASRAWVPRI